MTRSSDLITSLQASQLLGFTQSHIRRLITQGKIKAEKYGTVWVMKRSALNCLQKRDKEETNGSDSGSE